MCAGVHWNFITFVFTLIDCYVVDCSTLHACESMCVLIKSILCVWVCCFFLHIQQSQFSPLVKCANVTHQFWRKDTTKMTALKSKLIYVRFYIHKHMTTLNVCVLLLNDQHCGSFFAIFRFYCVYDAIFFCWCYWIVG